MAKITIKKTDPNASFVAGQELGRLVSPWIWGWAPMLALGAIHDDYAKVPALGYLATAASLFIVTVIGTAWRPVVAVKS